MGKNKKKLTPYQLLDFFDSLVIYNNERRIGTPDCEALCALANRINNEYFHRFSRFLLFVNITGGNSIST